jgi:hypothetical protein
MRASKLIAISTIAVLIGGTGLAIGEGSLHGGHSIPGSSMNYLGGHHVATNHLGSAYSSRPGRIGSHGSGPFARATSKEMEAGLKTHDLSRLHDMARDLPRISNAGAEMRIDALVPKHVREAAAPLPPEVQRMFPHFRQARAFLHHDHIVIVNPATSRIVAIAKT